MVEAAVAADPGDRTAQRRLAPACLNIADALTLTDPTEAARYYRRMIGIMDRMSHDDPGNLTNRRIRALGEYSLSDALLKSRSPQAAVPYITSAISTMERLTKADANRVYFGRDLATAIRISGEIHLALGEDRAALTAMQAAHERARQLSDAHSADNACLSVLADTLRSLGHLYETSRAFRNPEMARTFYSHEVEIWQRWPARTTTSAYDQGRLRAALEHVGRL